MVERASISAGSTGESLDAGAFDAALRRELAWLGRSRELVFKVFGIETSRSDTPRATSRVLVEAAWAYRHPAKVSLHIQQRIDQLPKALQDLGWKAQVRLCKRFRRLVARGKHPNVVVTAIARELIAFMWAIARAMPHA